MAFCSRSLPKLCPARTFRATTGTPIVNRNRPKPDSGSDSTASSQEPMTCLGMMSRGSGRFRETPTELGVFRRNVVDALLVVGFSAIALWLDEERRIRCQEGAKVEEKDDGGKEEKDRQQQPPEAKSNIHTAKWRVFTDKARKLSSQGLYDDAEKYFYKALEEAKIGFGDGDPHVASCYNNLAELYRMKKEYEKAEPFYVEAISQLLETSGVQDGSAGFALHNLAGFYLLQRKLGRAQECYEEALKIKGRALGFDHPEYANTMFHLGEVIRLRGDVNGAVDLMRGSIMILEQIGLGSTAIAIKRRGRLSEVLLFSGHLKEAEVNQRKAVQILEFSKDASALDVASGIELLVTILLKQGKFDECEGLLERCISVLRDNRDPNDIHLAASLLKLGGILLQKGRKSLVSSGNNSTAHNYYGKAEELLMEAARIGEMKWRESILGTGNGSLENKRLSCVRGLLLSIQSLVMLGELGIHKLDVVPDSQASLSTHKNAEEALRRAMVLLDDAHVQEVLKPSEAKRFRMECSENMTRLHERGTE